MTPVKHSLYVPSNVHTALKMEAARRGMTMSEIVGEIAAARTTNKRPAKPGAIVELHAEGGDMGRPTAALPPVLSARVVRLAQERGVVAAALLSDWVVQHFTRRKAA